MTLPSSGPMSGYQICDEFGVSRSATLPGALYGKPGVPSSGPLSFSSFYGLSNVIFSPDGGNVSAEGINNASLTITCNQSATWTWNNTGNPLGSSVSVSSGGSATSITFSLTAGPGGGGTTTPRNTSWSLTGSAAGVTRTFNVSLIASGNQ